MKAIRAIFSQFSGRYSRLGAASIQLVLLVILTAPLARGGLNAVVGNELCAAAETGDEKRVEAILKRGVAADARNASGQTALMRAAFRGQANVVNLLLQNGADPSAQSASDVGTHVLTWAVSGGKLQIISDLVAKGANMNVRARNGLSPLGAAVHENKPETVSFLIKQGADVNMPGISYRSQDESDKRLISPLASAAHSGCLEIVQSLVLGGSTLDLEDSRGDTPIMFAARARHPEVVTYLIERGATVNHTGKDGHTALIYAAYQGRMDIVQALLKAGADPACVACDRVGDRITSKYTAADVALQQHYPEIMALLRTEMFKRRNP